MNSILWYIQGLNGGPRRYSVLPDSYEPLAVAAVPFALMVGIGQLVFAWNLWQTMRGRQRRDDERPVLLDGRQLSLGGGTVLAAVAVPMLFFAIKNLPEDYTGPGPQAAAEKPAELPKGPGQDLFVSNCGSCHALAAAETPGGVGFDLDSIPVDEQRVVAAIENGGTGSGQMPANLVQGEEAQQVAEFVVAASASGSP